MIEVFPEPSLTAFRRQKNLRDLLLRARVPGPPRLHELRVKRGMAQCEAPCTACPYVKRMKQIRISENSYWHINREENCTSFNVVYLIECDKEKHTMKYIRENKEFFFFMIRLDDHRGYILPKDKS